MKKIKLKVATQQLTKEQMRKIAGGEDPDCLVGTNCDLIVPGGVSFGTCNSLQYGCGCYDGYGNFGGDDVCFPVD